MWPGVFLYILHLELFPHAVDIVSDYSRPVGQTWQNVRCGSLAELRLGDATADLSSHFKPLFMEVPTVSGFTF